MGARDDLNDRQRQVLRLVARSIRATGIAPSVQEIAEEVGVHFSSAYNAVNSLVRKGRLRRIPDVPRGLEVLREEDGAPFQPLLPFAEDVQRLP